MTPAETDLPDGALRVLRAADARGLDVQIVARPDARDLPGAARLLGLEPRQVVKTLVVKRHDGTFVLVLVPGDRQISWSRLRAAVGVNKLSLPSPDVALEATGYARGTITPLGSSTDWPVHADERITGRVALGAGAPGHSALVDAAQLLAAYDARVADLTDPLPEQAG